jgi:Subtilase family
VLSLPLIVWPAATKNLSRPKNGGRGLRPSGPGAGRQGERLDPRFDTLAREVERQRSRLEHGATGAFPELVLVFEVIGAIDGFVEAVRKIEGLSWLVEEMEEDLDPDDDFNVATGKLPLRLYFIAANDRGVAELLSLWRRYLRAEAFAWGLTPWRDLFALLHDVRPWGRQDRLVETGALRAWMDQVQNGAASVEGELDLWVRGGGTARSAQADAERRVRSALSDLGGTVLDGPAWVEEAGVHLVLVRLPKEGVRRLEEDPAVGLAQLADIRTMRVASQASAFTSGKVSPLHLPDAPLPRGVPVVAVLDGVPMQNHKALAGRIVVDDPLNLSGRAPVVKRAHGTAVCSLVIWGDLHDSSIGAHTPPTRPIHVSPVLIPDEGQAGEESGPGGRLFLDLLHGAVARMFEGEWPTAPDVSVINLSIGERNRPFFGEAVGPLARLLDYLSWRHKVLFIVSAGNFNWTWEEFPEADPADLEAPPRRQALLLRRASQDRASRTLLSPAESINALTVGALDHDASDEYPPPFHPAWITGTIAPALYSRIGPGYRRSPKPEVLAPGGRQPVQRKGHSLQPYSATPTRAGAPGLRVAAPGTDPLFPTDGARSDRGTSYAAALMSHSAAKISDMLDSLTAADPDLLQRAPRAVWLKTLLVHASSRKSLEAWVAPLVEGTDTQSRGKNQRRHLDALAGYGIVDLDRALGCTTQRVTVLAGGALRGDGAHEYRFPLPASLIDVKGSFRRHLTATLSWISPTRPLTWRYRGALLGLEPVRTPGLTWDGSERGDPNILGSGTVVHLVKHGRGFAEFAPGDGIVLLVTCRGDAAQPLDEEVPYALAVTLEVEVEAGIDIYTEIAAAVRVQTAVRASVGVRSPR